MFNSQFGEDEWIAKNINLPTYGVVIDVGACEPIFSSNSYYFEHNLGWGGICIDADSRTIDKLKQERKNVVQAIVSDKNGVGKFFHEAAPGISHVSDDGTEEVETRTLDSILEQFNIGDVTILDIDVEGHELSVCRGLDWEKYKPNIVIIEYISPAGGNIEVDILKYFDALGTYSLVHKTSSNLIFVLKDYVATA
jgi:FkbM family methyltransferase